MPKRDFNKVALLCNLIEVAIWHWCFPINLLHIFRTPLPKKHLWIAAFGCNIKLLINFKD